MLFGFSGVFLVFLVDRMVHGDVFVNDRRMRVLRMGRGQALWSRDVGFSMRALALWKCRST